MPLASRAIGSKPIAMRLPVRMPFKMDMFPYVLDLKGYGFVAKRAPVWSKKSCVYHIGAKAHRTVSGALLIQASDNPRPVRKLC